MRILKLHLITIAGVACAATNQIPSDANTELVAAFADAYNRHDVLGMLRMVDDSIELLSIAGADLSVDARGKQALSAGLEDYFDSFPTSRSELVIVSSLGPFVTTQERAVWDNEKQEQSSVGVYEINDGVIKRVWYFPAVRP